MKNVLLLCALIVTAYSQAQNPREILLDNFDTVKVYDLMTVNLVKSDQDKIIISGKDADDVEYVYKNGILKIRMAFEKQFDGTETFVQVHYTSLKTIDGNEGAYITSNELIEQPRLEIRVQEGAHVKAGVIVEHIDIKAVSGGIVEVSGTVDHQDLNVNTGGIVENQELKSSHTKVKLKAGGEVEIHASESVDINITAGGDVQVYGNPRKVSKKTFAGGRIVMRD